MKARQRVKKFTAVFLTLAMLITALPLQVFAYIPGHDTEAGFKNMYMHSAVNQRPIATYMYGDNTNYFNCIPFRFYLYILVYMYTVLAQLDRAPF